MKEILFYPEEHLYLVDGVEYPSVTTILGILSNSEYSKVSKEVLEYAARRGTLVHEYTELVDYGLEPEEIEAEVLPYIQAYQTFLRDYKPDWNYIEAPAYSVQTLGFKFCGTVDRAGVINGKKCVVDIKTLASPTKMNKFSVVAQTSAYQAALSETYGFEAEKSYALYLGKDGDYTLMDCEEYEHKYGVTGVGIFDRCASAYYFVDELKNIKAIKKGK